MRGAFIKVLLIPLFMTLMISASAEDLQAAAPMKATVVKVDGQVEMVLKNGKRQQLKTGDQLLAHHVIESAKGGAATLQLDDGSTVEIFEATRIEINDLLPEEESKFSVSLFFGRISAKLKRLRGDDVVITPTMVAGVRGTEFYASVAEDGASVITVKEGQVAVSTDKAWDETEDVTVKAGQEVEADKAGVTLTPRPITLDSLEAWTKYRQQRLNAIKADLPQIIAEMEKDVDPNLEILDKIKALPQDRTKVLSKLDERLKELGPADIAEKAKLTIQTHMEASNVLSLVKRFRKQRMRLKSTFVQSERLKSLLPNFEKELGPEYKSVDEGLKRILAREKEVESKADKIAADFNAAVEPAQPLLDKFKKPQFNLNNN